MKKNKCEKEKEMGMEVCSTNITDLNLGLRLCYTNKSQEMGHGVPEFMECLLDDDNSVPYFLFRYCSMSLSSLWGTLEKRSE